MSFAFAIAGLAAKGAAIGVTPGGIPDPPPPMEATWTERAAAILDWHLPLNEASGTAATAEIGANGTYVGSPQLGVATMALDDEGNTCVGLSGAQHIEVTSPLNGTALTVLMLVQFDEVTSAKQILAGQASATAGGFALEIVTSQVRGYSRVDGGTAHPFTGSAGNVQQGTVHLVAYRRQSGASPSQQILVDGVVVAADETSRTWPALPAGTFYAGTYIDGSTSPLDGLVQHLGGANSWLTDAEIATLVHKTDSVAHVVDLDAGTVLSDDTLVLALAPSDLLREGLHGKLPIIATAGNGTEVTTTEAGDDITIDATDAAEGADSLSYSITDANSNVSGSADIVLLVDSEGGGGGGDLENAHDALVMAAPGQVSDAYIKDATTGMYWISRECTDTMRISHNDQNAVSLNGASRRNNFRDTRTISFGAVNDRTERTQIGYNHSAWIEPSAAYTTVSGEPVASYPSSLSHGGVIRHTARYGTNGTGDNGFGATWNPEGDNVKNFRKDNFFLRHIAPRDGFVIVDNETELVYDREYEAGFTVWFAGEANWHRQESGAIFQLHGQSPVQLYFRRSGTNWAGYTSNGNGGSQVNFTPFPIDTGANTIHVIRIQFGIHSSSGYIRIWYQGNQVVNSTGRPVGSVGVPHKPHLMMLYQNPPDGANEGETWTMFSDRFFLRCID